SYFFFFSSRRRHTRCLSDWSSDVCSSDLGTLRALQARRKELIDPTIAACHGRIVKTTGDGLLVEFPSAVEAVACAISVQQGIALRNQGVAEDKRLIFRIGINVGDIIIEA